MKKKTLVDRQATVYYALGVLVLLFSALWMLFKRRQQINHPVPPPEIVTIEHVDTVTVGQEAQAPDANNSSSPPHVQGYDMDIEEEPLFQGAAKAKKYSPKDILITVQNISLYLLWTHESVLAQPLLQQGGVIDVGTDSIGCYYTFTGNWSATQFIWIPSNTTRDGFLTEEETKNAVNVLENTAVGQYLQRMPSIKPAYRILHIEKLHADAPRLTLFDRKKRRTELEQSIDDARETFVEDIQLFCKLGRNDRYNSWQPSKFSHYDQERQGEGWLVVSPILALCVNLSRDALLTITSSIHSRDVYTQVAGQTGIMPEPYEETLRRVAQWDSTQDVLNKMQEAAAQLDDLVKGGQKAVDGQISLSFVLTLIGVFIAFFTTTTLLNNAQIGVLGLLFVASFLFWFYSRGGRDVVQVLGWILASLALYVVFAIFVLPRLLPFLQHLLKH